MGFFQFINHLLNFMLPAAFMGVFFPLLCRAIWRKKKVNRSLKSQMLITSLTGVGILFAGLFIFSTDGKMMTYFALVMSAALYQWWWRGDWRGNLRDK